jgi:uncharacterized protein
MVFYFTNQKGVVRLILDGYSKQKPDIEYPCRWQYKIISNSAEGAVRAAETAANGFEYDIISSNVSAKGKYVSINLFVQVETEEERNFIFGQLENHEEVIMVI